MVDLGDGRGLEGMATLVPAVCHLHDDDRRLLAGKDSNSLVLGL